MILIYKRFKSDYPHSSKLGGAESDPLEPDTHNSKASEALTDTMDVGNLIDYIEKVPKSCIQDKTHFTQHWTGHVNIKPNEKEKCI